jgi:altronate dehydratase
VGRAQERRPPKESAGAPAHRSGGGDRHVLETTAVAASIERNGDLKTLSAAARVAQQFMQQASELTREPIERHELTISIKCGASDTTTGLGSCPTVAQAVDRHVGEGGTVIFGETSELTGGEHLIAERCADATVRAAFQRMYDGYIAEAEHIDLDVSGLLWREYTLREAGGRLMALIDRTANGRLTCAEALGHREFVLTKLDRSA